MPKISIITPVYVNIPQKAEWLNQMIQSVIGQTFTDWELILIDDKSPVGFSKISDGRLRWLENAANEGPAKTRNTAVALAESDCILPLDSDDLLADSQVLETMYNVWSQDKTKIIYGNLQMYRQTGPNVFQRGKMVKLGEYTFELAMNLRGIMPVTAMHSVNCHQRAGGWKNELDHGLEDVEYWIAAGKAGFCGQKIEYTTLIYRQQESSRAYNMKISEQFRPMQEKIRAMHSDIYKGEFPMGCCGKGNATATANVRSPNVDPLVASAQNQTASKITELQGYDEGNLEWVAYQGAKKGRFDVLVRGPNNLPSSYAVFGTGHYFQIHKQHHKHFSDRQHLGFRINQPDPRQPKEPEPEPQPTPAPQVVSVPKPELSTLLRPDRIATETRQIEITQRQEPAEIIIEPNAPKSVSDMMISYTLSDLGLSDKQFEVLSHDRWTVQSLAETTPKKLSQLPGIGVKTGQKIIDKAKELIVR